MRAREAYLTVLGQIDLERVGVVLEAERRHRKQDIFSIDGFPTRNRNAHETCLSRDLD